MRYAFLHVVCALVALTTSVDTLRLPTSVVPEYYTLQILTFLEDGFFEFDGNVLIKIKCLKPTKNITLHASELEINTDKVVLTEIDKNDQASSINILSHDFDEENEFYILNLKNNLKVNTYYELSIPFKGILTEGLAGFYRSSYFDKKANETKWIATTQFEATDARRAFPCFDEPEMKAVFSIRIGHHENHVALSNMPLSKTEKIEDGWVLDHFEDTVRMSTYLVAFIVCDFVFKYGEKVDSNDVLFRIWARNDAIEQVDFAASVGPKYLAYYENFFNVKYPLPKQDMIAIPDFNAGAMENWGLITYRETALLYDSERSSASNKHSIASTVAHELAHQWFGNLVTMKWWTDLWLNEGFATYMSSKAVHHVNPEWNSFDEDSVDNLLTVYNFDALESSHPISVEVNDPNDISEIFDSISYKKGSLILRMMNYFLGEDVFRRGLSNYLNKFKYRNADQNDLWQSLTEEAQKQNVLGNKFTVKDIMDSWTLQIGFPIVHVERDYENNVVTLTQTRFLKGQKRNTNGTEKHCWWIPLTYTTASAANFSDTATKKWFRCQPNKEPVKTVITLDKEIADNEWIIFNIQSAGLYKVNYDDRNWKLLINVLLEDYESISILQRIQLLHDSMDMAYNGALNYGLTLKLYTYLRSEVEYLPWEVAMDQLSFLGVMLKRRPSYGMYKEYVREILTPIYEKVAYEHPEKSADAVKRQVLISAWACKFEVGDCREQALELFKQWMRSKKPDSYNPIPLDLRSVIYCTAIRNGNIHEWEFLWNRYLSSNVGTEKNIILGSLGCSEQGWILNRYLDWSLSNSSAIRKQDAVRVFSAVARSDIGFFMAKMFFFERLPEIRQFLGKKTDRLSRYVKTLARQMITEQELTELRSFSGPKENLFKGARMGFKQAVEGVELNVEWQNRHYKTFVNVLSDHLRKIK